MIAPQDPNERRRMWRTIFAAAQVNRSGYVDPRTETALAWRFPKDTWFQRRLRLVRSWKEK